MTQIGVWTDRRDWCDAALSAAAAAGVTALEEVEAERVVVGVDTVDELNRGAPPQRAIVVGDDPGELAAASAQTGWPVLILPDELGALTRWCRGAGASGAAVVALVGCAGGVGTSVLAAGLAQWASGRGVVTALVDLDDAGGNVAALSGAPAWEWSEFAGSRGELDASVWDGAADLTVIGGPVAEVGDEAVAAVVESLRGVCELVVLDVGRGRGRGAWGVSVADRVVTVGDGVRGAADAGGVRVVTQVRPGPAVGRGAVVVPFDRAVSVAVQVGEPPLRVAGRRWRRAVAALGKAVA